MESEQPLGIFMMLCEHLQKSNIPGQTTMQTQIHKLLDNHLNLLKWALQVCLGDISFNVTDQHSIEIGWQALFHNGYLDRLAATAILGNNSTLD